MTRKVRSARGEVLDFDLIKIKEKMATTPQSLHVRKRKDFIEQRLRRRIKKAAGMVEEEKRPEVVATGMNVEPTLPDTEVVEKKEEIVEMDKPEENKPTTRQKAKRKTTAVEGEKNDTESNS